MKTRILATMLFCAVSLGAAAQNDVLSSKPNVPVKKENFPSKLERYKNEGFKVAVVLAITPLATSKPSSTSSSGPSMGGSSNSTKIVLKGEIELNNDDFKSLAESYAAQMNEAFSTDAFEVIDGSTIPKKTTKWGEVSDWGATKYKMVATYSILPVYNFDNFSSKKTAKFLVNQSAIIAEYVNEKKGVKIKYPVRAGGLGFYTTSFDDTDQLTGLKTVDELQTVVNPPMGADLAAKLQASLDENLPAYIEKRKKK